MVKNDQAETQKYHRQMLGDDKQMWRRAANGKRYTETSNTSTVTPKHRITSNDRTLSVGRLSGDVAWSNRIGLTQQVSVDILDELWTDLASGRHVCTGVVILTSCFSTMKLGI